MTLPIDPARLLDALAGGLAQHVTPTVTDDYARSTLQAATHLLWRHRIDRDTTLRVDSAAAHPQALQTHRLLLAKREQRIAELERAREGAEPPLTAERLTAHLRRRYPQDAHLRVHNLAKPAGGGGFGKEILLFDIVRRDGAIQSVVLRRDKAVHFTGTSVQEEYPLLCALSNAGYPAPRPLWLETADPDIPRPFLVTERAPGQPAGAYATYARVQEDRNSVLVRLLSALHSLDVSSLQLPDHFDRVFDDEALLRMLDYWAQRYQSVDGFNDPVLTLGFSWLRKNVSQGVTEPVLVHADFGFHNVLLDDRGRATLLDWEGAHIGSAAEDLAAAREALRAPGAFNRFLDEYTQLTGKAPPSAALSYYEVFRLVRRAALCCSIVGMFNRGQHRDLRSTAICAKIYSENIQALCERLAQ